MTALGTVMDALASQIENYYGGTAPVLTDLQVDGRLVPNPTPPAVDVYPGDPFQESFAYGKGNVEMFFTVRARVSTADNEGGQDLLLSLMDPNSATSMLQAILSNRTLGGLVERVATVEGPTAYGLYRDSVGEGNLLGCQWRVRVIP